jgi:hypothetical protein
MFFRALLSLATVLWLTTPQTPAQVAARDPAVGAADAEHVEPPPLTDDAGMLNVDANGVSVEPPLPQPDVSVDATSEAVPVRHIAETPRRFRYSMLFDARAVYDDNVRLSVSETREADFYGSLASEVTLALGDREGGGNFVSANLTPTLYLYADNSDLNTVELVARLQGQWRLRRVTFSLSQDVRSIESTNLAVINPAGGFANQANLDLRGRRRLNTYDTHLEASGPWTGKTSFRIGSALHISEPEDSIGSTSLEGVIGVDYHYAEKLSTGLSLTAGRTFAEAPSPDQTYEQLTVRWDYDITGKLRATGSGGVEFRQSNGGAEDYVSPIFQLGVGYTPFDGTRIDLSATQQTLNSASSAGQDFTSTQFTGTLGQRFLQRVFLTVSGGYQIQDYRSTLESAVANREDKYFFFATGFDVRLSSFWFAGFFYTYRQVDSTEDIYAFNSNLYGLRTILAF